MIGIGTGISNRGTTVTENATELVLELRMNQALRMISD